LSGSLQVSFWWFLQESLLDWTAFPPHKKVIMKQSEAQDQFCFVR
jgi:hypothetical protein